MINSFKYKIYSYLFCVLLGFYLAISVSVVQASQLYLIPQSQSVYFGDTFVVEARIDAENREINTIEGVMFFPQHKLEVIDINKGGSVISLWVQDPVYSNEKGEIAFSGGMPNGFIGQGEILKITFKVIDSGADSKDVRIYFRENSNILLNDGKGTRDQITFVDGNYKIIEKEAGLPVIYSPFWSDQEKWYRGNEVKLHWDLIKDAEYSYILSKDVLAEPDNIPDKPEGAMVWMGDMTLKGFTEDGVYYFSLKQKLPEKDWSSKVNFKIMIDNLPPEEFVSKITEIEGKKYLIFNARDAASGVDRYEVLEFEQKVWTLFEKKFNELLPKKLQKKEEWKKAVSPYLLEDQGLTSNIKIKAVDRSGNERLAEIIPPKKEIPYKKIGLSILFIIVIILILAWVKYLKCKNKKTCG